MAQLPTPVTTPADNWGVLLNAFLAIAHIVDDTNGNGGKLKSDLTSIVEGGKIGIGKTPEIFPLELRGNYSLTDGLSINGIRIERTNDASANGATAPTTAKPPRPLNLNIFASDEDNYDNEAVLTIFEGTERDSIFIGPNSNSGGVGRVEIDTARLVVGNTINEPDFQYLAGFAGKVHVEDNLMVKGGTHGWGIIINEQGSSLSIGVSAKNNEGEVASGQHDHSIIQATTDVDTTIAFQNGSIVSNIAISISSDQRLKENITDEPKALEKIEEVRVVNYTLKSDTHKKERTGVIAQEIQEIYPNLVSENKDGILSVDYAGLSCKLLQAVKELSQKVSDLESKINN